MLFNNTDPVKSEDKDFICNLEKPFRVLSLDGGGMRGLYTLSLLETLIKRFNENTSADFDIGKNFDLIVGTSTGGILACAIAAGIPLSIIKMLYQEHGKEIFQNPIPQNKLSRFFWMIKFLFKSANNNKNLKKLLNSIFGNMTVKKMYEMRGIGLCLTAVNMMTYIPRVFKTPHNPEKILDNDRKISDLCLATSAAPILFPIANIPLPNNSDVIECFIDGGLWANNPILISLVEAKEMAKNRNIEVVSIGTCPPPKGKNLSDRESKQGILFWKAGIEILETSMNAQTKGNDFIAKFLAKHLNAKIIRLQSHSPSIELTNHLSLDDASKKSCALLIQLGQHDAMMTSQHPETYEILKNIFTNLSILK